MKIESPQQSYDLVVVGGGMVGASFACALSRAIPDKNLSIMVVEAVDQSVSVTEQPSFDARSTALSFGSRQIYESMGLWPQLAEVVTPIKEIHVSDKGRFGSTHISHSDHDVEALGYVIENKKLGVVLNHELDSSDSIALLSPATIATVTPTANGMSLEIDAGETSFHVETPLVVLADGGRSPICDQLGIGRTVESYKQHAVIANIALERPHNHVAYERFTDTGPLAVLPLESFEGENRASLVWTVAENESGEIMPMDDEELLSNLMERFGDRLGRFTHIGEKFCYPLSLSIAREQIRPGLVLLGNVAHTLHPVAGQGLNLALRDCAALVKVLQQAHVSGHSLGAMQVLQEYVNQQDFDQQKSISFTNYLTRLFSSNSRSRVWARKFGLLSIDLLPPIKRGIAKQAMGLPNR
jgi:2-octaprenyl-6-methoxyphenol hydroxylase